MSDIVRVPRLRPDFSAARDAKFATMCAARKLYLAAWTDYLSAGPPMPEVILERDATVSATTQLVPLAWGQSKA